MKTLGIVGPSKPYLKKGDGKNIKVIAEILAKNFKIIISPDKQSTAKLFAKAYKKAGGKQIIGVEYLDDTANGYLGLDRDLCDTLINCTTWEHQPKVLVQHADHLIVLGHSIGVTWELCLTKFYWYQQPQKKIFIIEELVKEKLPKYMNESLNIEYISIKDLQMKL